ncbi:MAG: class I SAM-dependent methyltransferase, partial [Erysipelotrichia bacterium]|nr:class I SAM-dependent methyltransferase [Erysipelotrichia bacterium]
MAHIQQQEFCRSVQGQFPEFFKNKFVLDIGSLDINGNNQEWFDNCKYLGVDIAYGRNVDIVSKGHELGFPDATFDVIISTECFEHDQYYISTIQNIYRMLKPGGLFIFTCATTGRPEHGTRRTTPEDAPLLQSDIEWSDYYKNLTENDIRQVLDIEHSFSDHKFSTNEFSHDLYFYGFKKGELIQHLEYSNILKDLPVKSPKVFCQLFIDRGDGISEENSIKLPVAQNEAFQEFIFDLTERQNIKTLRLDPLNECCVIEIESLHVKKNTEAIDLLPFLQSNAEMHHGKGYFFTTDDSQMYFNGLDEDTFENAQSLVVVLRYAHIAKDA